MPAADGARTAARLRRAFERSPWAWLLSATLASLAAAWLLKARCAGIGDVRIPKVSCYSDVAALYGERGFDHHLVPYLQSFNEYPPLTGLMQWGLSWLAWDQASFFAWNALALGLLAVWTTRALLRLAGPSPRILVWALGPPLALYAFYNWDLLAVLLATLALLAVSRQRFLDAGVLLGLATSAKWYPAVLAFVVAAWLLRAGSRKDLVRFVGGGALAALAVNLPFLVGNPNLFLQTYRFHISRPPNPDTLWAVAGHFADRAGWHGLASFLVGGLQPILTLALVASVVAIVWRVRAGRMHLLPAMFAALLLFVLLNKVFSIQYALWVLPFLALLEVPWAATALFVVATLLVDVTQRGMYEGLAGPALDHAWDKLAVGVVLRHAALLWMLLWCWRRPDTGFVLRWPSDPAAAGVEQQTP